MSLRGCGETGLFLSESRYESAFWTDLRPVSMCGSLTPHFLFESNEEEDGDAVLENKYDCSD